MRDSLANRSKGYDLIRRLVEINVLIVGLIYLYEWLYWAGMYSSFELSLADVDVSYTQILIDGTITTVNILAAVSMYALVALVTEALAGIWEKKWTYLARAGFTSFGIWVTYSIIVEPQEQHSTRQRVFSACLVLLIVVIGYTLALAFWRPSPQVRWALVLAVLLALLISLPMNYEEGIDEGLRMRGSSSVGKYEGSGLIFLDDEFTGPYFPAVRVLADSDTKLPYRGCGLLLGNGKGVFYIYVNNTEGEHSGILRLPVDATSLLPCEGLSIYPDPSPNH